MLDCCSYWARRCSNSDKKRFGMDRGPMPLHLGGQRNERAHCLDYMPSSGCNRLFIIIFFSFFSQTAFETPASSESIAQEQLWLHERTSLSLLNSSLRCNLFSWPSLAASTLDALPSVVSAATRFSTVDRSNPSLADDLCSCMQLTDTLQHRTCHRNLQRVQWF
jgi:hypothetical protein